MWTPTTRAQHSRAGLRYGSDVTDAEWLILSPFLPGPRPCGRNRKWEMREIVNAIFYVLRGGIAWGLLPKDVPPASTAYRWFARFRDDGTFRTETGPGRCCGPRARVGPSWRWAMPMVVTLVLALPRPARSASKWCARLTTRSASPSSHGAGWSTVLRLDQPEQATRKGLRGDDRERRSLPLRRFQRHPATPAGPLKNRFEIDSMIYLVPTIRFSSNSRLYSLAY